MFRDYAYAPKSLGLMRERYATESVKHVEHIEKIMASVKFKGK